MNLIEACKLMIDNNGGYIRHPGLRDVGTEREYMHCNYYVTDEWDVDFWLDMDLYAYILEEEEFDAYDLRDQLNTYLTAKDFIRNDWEYKPEPKESK